MHRAMSSMPTVLVRALTAWNRPRQRHNREFQGSSTYRFHYLQELLQTKKDADINGVPRGRVTPEFSNDVCQMQESPYRILKMAAKGDESEIERLCVADRTRVQVEDSKGWNAVHHAAANNQPLSIVLLFNHGADINWQDNNGRTPLHIAVEKESIDAIDTLIHCNCDTKLVDIDGFSAFHRAVLLNKLRSLETLQQHLDKVDLHQGDAQGRTALHLAAKFDYVEAAKSLLESYAIENICPNIACMNGYSPIHIAARNASVAVLEAILKWGEARGCLKEKMICLPDLEGNEPLHLAVHGGEIKAIELCLKMGAIISKQQDDKSTPVHLACSQGSIDIVRLMFNLQPAEKSKVLETLDAQGMSPLHCAAMFDHPELVSFLIEEGALVDQVDQEHRTALWLAASRSGWRTVDVLLAHGADPTIRDINSKNLLHVVIMSGGSLNDVLSLKQTSNVEWWMPRLRAMLDEQDSMGWSPLHYASRGGQITSLASLLSLGACVRTKDIRNESPLHFAAKYGRYNTVRQLLESCNGFLILNECNDEGKTALHIASEEGHTRVVQLLISKGALLHKDHFGRTPLHLAATGGHTQVIKTLLAVHSHILDQTDKDGNTPLHMAVRANKPDVVNQLMSLNCKLLPDNNNCTPIDCAIMYKIAPCALALVSHERGPAEILAVKSKIQGCISMALIRTLPKVFESVLHQAVTKASVKEQSKDYFIKYSFYPLQLTNEQTEAEKMRLKDPNLKPPPLYTCNEMVECGRLELLMHPLTQRYLDMKWQAYGKAVHMFNLFTYLVYLSLVTVMAVGVLGDNTFGAFNNFTTIIETLHTTKEMKEPPGWMSVMAFAIVFLAVLSMVKELFQIYHHGVRYLMAAINFVQWTTYLTSVCMVTPILMNREWSTDHFNSAALAVFTAWFSLLFYFQRFDYIGIYIVMFLEILNTLLKVLFVFSVLIVAFGLAFYILLSHGGHLSFSNLPMSMLHTFSMMLGEIDFLNIFVYPFYGESPRGDVLRYPGTTFALLVIFMILMPILLMNLLIGLAVGDIESVKKNAQLKRIAMQVELHSDLESKLPEMIIKRVNKSELIIYPNRSKCQRIFTRILGALLYSSPVDDKELEALDMQRDDYLWEELESQQRHLRSISKVLDKQTQLLQLIMQKMEIRSEAEYDEGVCIEEINKAPHVPPKFKCSSAVSRKSVNAKSEG
ncbi:transient receptor potential cation channel subfamily A member 1 isoform X2 [Palaemon carinicauda]|uniref:transient receptor potential cation channel subfamily A member 1 isoform X2 n=1 Tax=Palaemon carinicauda TaxID=392227 RepID=UPI0035B575D5